MKKLIEYINELNEIDEDWIKIIELNNVRPFVETTPCQELIFEKFSELRKYLFDLRRKMIDSYNSDETLWDDLRKHQTLKREIILYLEYIDNKKIIKYRNAKVQKSFV